VEGFECARLRNSRWWTSVLACSNISIGAASDESASKPTHGAHHIEDHAYLLESKHDAFAPAIEALQSAKAGLNVRVILDGGPELLWGAVAAYVAQRTNTFRGEVVRELA
jgi:hypothetical protein